MRVSPLNKTGDSPKIGLALGSGASRGWSHIGIIKALLAEGLEPDVICGTSVGAMIGAAYLAGNLDKLEKWVLGATRTDVLRFFDVKFTQAGFVDTKRLNWFLHNYIAEEGRSIESLPGRFAAVSTNLETGREVWFTEGGLADAVRASMAMPGLFPAVRVDRRWLVDGGLVNPVPVSVCHALGADIVIAVNLNSGIVGKREIGRQAASAQDDKSAFRNIKEQAREYSSAIFPNRDKEDEAPGLFYAIANSINIFQDRITRSRMAGDPADMVLSPRVARIGMLEFHRASEAIDEGIRCVSEALPEIRRLGESGLK
jgi:NTE family protein